MANVTTVECGSRFYQETLMDMAWAWGTSPNDRHRCMTNVYASLSRKAGVRIGWGHGWYPKGDSQ